MDWAEFTSWFCQPMGKRKDSWIMSTVNKRERKPTLNLSTRHVSTAIAILSCHVSDLAHGVDPDSLRGMHYRDQSLEDKLKALAFAIVEAARSEEELEL